MFRTFQGERNIRQLVDAGFIQAPIDTAIPLGLLINELVTNSLKHAFPDGRAGEIRIVISQKKEQPAKLIVSDNGVGLPQEITPHTTTSLGLELIYAIARQLRASVQDTRHRGTVFEFTLPLI